MNQYYCVLVEIFLLIVMAFNSSIVPLKILRSTLSSTPGTVPTSVCCQNLHLPLYSTESHNNELSSKDMN